MLRQAAHARYLTGEELAFIRAALAQWGGPARASDAMARALGFSGARGIDQEAWELWGRIERGDALSGADWERVVATVEVSFASDVHGAGVDWHNATRFDDAEGIALLREIQRKRFGLPSASREPSAFRRTVGRLRPQRRPVD